MNSNLRPEEVQFPHIRDTTLHVFKHKCTKTLWLTCWSFYRTSSYCGGVLSWSNSPRPECDSPPDEVWWSSHSSSSVAHSHFCSLQIKPKCLGCLLMLVGKIFNILVKVWGHGCKIQDLCGLDDTSVNLRVNKKAKTSHRVPGYLCVDALCCMFLFLSE